MCGLDGTIDLYFYFDPPLEFVPGNVVLGGKEWGCNIGALAQKIDPHIGMSYHSETHRLSHKSFSISEHFKFFVLEIFAS